MTAKTRIAVVCPFSFSGAGWKQGLHWFQPQLSLCLRLPFGAIPTGYESTASLSGAVFHQSGSQAERFWGGRNQLEGRRFIYSKQNEITLPLEWHLCVCYLQCFTKWLNLKKKMHALVCFGDVVHTVHPLTLRDKADNVLFFLTVNKWKDQNQEQMYLVCLAKAW